MQMHAAAKTAAETSLKSATWRWLLCTTPSPISVAAREKHGGGRLLATVEAGSDKVPIIDQLVCCRNGTSPHPGLNATPPSSHQPQTHPEVGPLCPAGSVPHPAVQYSVAEPQR